MSARVLTRRIRAAMDDMTNEPVVVIVPSAVVPGTYIVTTGCETIRTGTLPVAIRAAKTLRALDTGVMT